MAVDLASVQVHSPITGAVDSSCPQPAARLVVFLESIKKVALPIFNKVLPAHVLPPAPSATLGALVIPVRDLVWLRAEFGLTIAAFHD